MFSLSYNKSISLSIFRVIYWQILNTTSTSVNRCVSRGGSIVGFTFCACRAVPCIGVKMKRAAIDVKININIMRIESLMLTSSLFDGNAQSNISMKLDFVNKDLNDLLCDWRIIISYNYRFFKFLSNLLFIFICCYTQ